MFFAMKKIVSLVFLLLVLGIPAIKAQSTAEEQKGVIAERKALAKLTEKDLQNRLLKRAKKDAKALARDGWKPTPGSADLAQQISEFRLKQYQLSGLFPKYIVGRGTAVAATLGMARKQALARARLDIASAMEIEVAALTESTESNTELTGGEAETIAKTVETSKSIVQQSLGRTEVVLELYRELDRKVEVQVAVSYDGARAKSEILGLFDNEAAELKGKLAKVLGGGAE